MKIELVQQSLFLCPHICLVWTHFDFLGVGLNCICLVFWGRLIFRFTHLKNAGVIFQLIIKCASSPCHLKEAANYKIAAAAQRRHFRKEDSFNLNM